MQSSIIWYVYDNNRSGADTVFFEDKEKALRYKVDYAARSGGNIKIKWCHRDSVPTGATIH